MGAEHGPNGVDGKYMAVPAPYLENRPNTPLVRRGTDVSKWLKNISIVLGMLIMLGGVVWGAARLSASFVDEDDLKSIDDRVELLEDNDIRQTIILGLIQQTLVKIEKKLDKIPRE